MFKIFAATPFVFFCIPYKKGEKALKSGVWYPILLFTKGLRKQRLSYAEMII